MHDRRRLGIVDLGNTGILQRGTRCQGQFGLCMTVGGMDAAVERTRMYLQRVMHRASYP
ncbi:MAG: hypothetical protein HKO60_04580 [Pseudomonadales bacterium]|nr:hypothetical protein [Pseudomonadales bacterium]